MNIGEILTDATTYPLSDWKKIVILGIILLLSNILIIKNINATLSTNIAIIYSFIIGPIIFLFVKGYWFRIIKFSLADEVELPEFNAWVNMFIDGIKVFIVTAVYMIPSILVLAALSFTSTLGIGSNPSMFLVDIILGSGIWSVIAILYSIIILPLMLMAIANMANNDSKLGAAFKFREILNKISSIGWIKLIVWYILTVIIFLFFATVGIFIIVNISFLLTPPIVEQLLLVLILIPYLFMYLARSTALCYKSE